jgi:integrase
MREKLSDRFARSAAPGIYFDPDRRSPRGFLLRVTPAGARAWCLNYRVRDGKERRLTIGDVAAWPIGEARRRAAELRRVVDEGGDPLGEREAARAEATVAELWARFQAEALPKRAPRTRDEYRAMWRDWIEPALGRRKVGAVDREDVEKLHRKITAEGKLRRANAVKSLCSVLFAKAITWKLCTDNPAKGIENNTEHSCERFLEAEEIARLLAEVARRRELGGHWLDSADQIELAVYTGARRGEIIGMRWSQIVNLGGAASWTLSSRVTKEGKTTGRTKRLPLSEGAAAILRRRRDEHDASAAKVVRLRADDHVFCDDAKAASVQLESDWRIIRVAAGLEGVRFHDLRHSFASAAINQGLSLEIIGKLLGHSQAATTQRYAHLAEQTLRAATEKVGDVVRGRRK